MNASDTSDSHVPRTLRVRCVAALVLVIAALLALAGRLVYIHVAEGPMLVQRAAQQQRGVSVLKARRGSIYDARGRLIAGTRLMYEVFIDPAMVEDVDALADKLAPRLNLPARSLTDQVRASQGGRYIRVASCLEEADAHSIRQLGLAGVGLTEHPVRNYPLGSAAAHVLGIVGRDGQGLEALELQYDAHLRGRDGVLMTVRDGARRPVWPRPDESEDPLDGGHLILTLDAEIQRIAEAQLDEAVRKYQAESGVAIVMDPFSGAVLALTCRPTFSPSQYQDAPAANRRNRALTDPMEPGSIYKPFVAAGALMCRLVSPTEKIDCHNGVYQFGGRTMHDDHPQGLLDLRGIIVESSNIGMGIIGTRMGNDRLHQIVRAFGFGEPLGIELPGESGGIVVPLRQWNRYTTTSVPIGQELAVTPLQLATAFSAIVNGGVLVRPFVVRSVLAPNGDVVESRPRPQVIRRVLPESVARYLAQEAMAAVVEEGGGGNLRLAEYTMLGKTGTAQVPYEHRAGYEPNMYLGSFMGAAPAGDPKLAAIVMIRKPNRSLGYYGRMIAGPAVGQILTQSLQYLGVPPDRPAPPTPLASVRNAEFGMRNAE